MDESDFYKRQSILENIGTLGQQKLKNARVIIVGAGGLAHPASTYLCAAGIGHLTIYDMDVVNFSNLNRQILFKPNDAGNSKAKILAQSLSKQNPFISVEYVNERVGPNSVLKIIESCDIVLDCTDNFATKFLLHDSAWFMNKDLIQASIYQYEGQLQGFYYSTNKSLGCLRCLWPTIPSEACVGNCQETGVIGAVAGTLGSMQAMEVIKRILWPSSVKINTTLNFNLLNYNLSPIKWKRDYQCPLCSEHPTITSINHETFFPLHDYETNSIDPANDILIDIREDHEKGKNEFHEELIIYNNPLSLIDQWKPELLKDKKYIFVCSKGNRSLKLVSDLRKQNYKNCFSLYKGIDGAFD